MPWAQGDRGSNPRAPTNSPKNTGYAASDYGVWLCADFRASRRVHAGRFATGGNLRILAHLLEMRAHGAAGHLWVAALHRRENAFVMNLAALRPAFNLKDSNALCTQQSDNGIY